jgi:hypothetical protein
MKRDNAANKYRNNFELHEPHVNMNINGGFVERPVPRMDARNHREFITSSKLKNKALLENPNFHTGGLSQMKKHQSLHLSSI